MISLSLSLSLSLTLSLSLSLTHTHTHTHTHFPVGISYLYSIRSCLWVKLLDIVTLCVSIITHYNIVGSVNKVFSCVRHDPRISPWESIP